MVLERRELAGVDRDLTLLLKNQFKYIIILQILLPSLRLLVGYVKSKCKFTKHTAMSSVMVMRMYWINTVILPNTIYSSCGS